MPLVSRLNHECGGSKMDAGGKQLCQESQSLGADSYLASNVPKIQLMSVLVAWKPVNTSINSQAVTFLTNEVLHPRCLAVLISQKQSGASAFYVPWH